MARYQHLPVYQTIYSITRELYRLKIKFPKHLKNDLGELFCASGLRCIRCVIFANGSQKKMKALQELLLEVETLWTLSRLAYDLLDGRLRKGPFYFQGFGFRAVEQRRRPLFFRYCRIRQGSSDLLFLEVTLGQPLEKIFPG